MATFHKVFAALVACAVLLITSVAEAQPGRGGRGFGGGNGYQDLLRNDDIRKELELVDDQIDEIRKATEGRRPDFRELFSGFRELSEEQRSERFAEIREKMAARQKELDKTIADVLLPHQSRRLRQIQVQASMRGDAAGSLTRGALAEELKITDEQKEKLAKAREEAEKELREKIEKARKEAEQKILSVLSPGQQAKIKEMVGKPFEFRRQERSRGGR